MPHLEIFHMKIMREFSFDVAIDHRPRQEKTIRYMSLSQSEMYRNMVKLLKNTPSCLAVSLWTSLSFITGHVLFSISKKIIQIIPTNRIFPEGQLKLKKCHSVELSAR